MADDPTQHDAKATHSKVEGSEPAVDALWTAITSPNWPSRVEKAMTSEEEAAFLYALVRLNPSWRGARVADFLDTLINADALLQMTEAIWKGHHSEVSEASEAGLLTAATLAAAYAYGYDELDANALWPHVLDIIQRVRAQPYPVPPLPWRGKLGIWTGPDL